MTPAGVNHLVRSVLAALALVVGLLGGATAVTADVAVVQIVVAGALASPTGNTAGGELTLRAGVGLPVFVVDNGAVVPGAIATATFIQVTDSTPTTGFGPHADVVVLRLGGGIMLVASRIDTPGGPVSALSGVSPIGTLSGTWNLASGAGITGSGPNDGLLTLTLDTNPNNTINGVVLRLAALGVFPQTVKPVANVGLLTVGRNIPIHDILVTSPALAGDSKGSRIGTMTSFFVFNIPGAPDDYVELAVIDFGGVYLLSPCAYPTPGVPPRPCLAGATNPVAALSGTVLQIPGQLSGVSGLVEQDLVLELHASLP